MSWIMVDIEADGPIPGDYSMVAIGAVIVEEKLDKTFYGQLRPISDTYDPAALEVAGFSREETLQFDEPLRVMRRFDQWLETHSRGRPRFMSDSGFDWMFVCWYFHHFLDRNPFGHASTHLGSLYKGVVRNVFENFKHLRVTTHTHHPVDDAMGNAEALLRIISDHDLKIKL